LRQPHGEFYRHVNPADYQHRDRRAGEHVHPHMIARRDEPDVGGVIVDRELRGHRETGNGALGNGPIDHPDHPDDESGK